MDFRLEKMFKKAFRAFLKFEWLLQYIRRPLTPEKAQHLQILLEQLRDSHVFYVRTATKLSSLADRLNAVGVTVDHDALAHHWKVIAKVQRNITQVEDILRREYGKPNHQN